MAASPPPKPPRSGTVLKAFCYTPLFLPAQFVRLCVFRKSRSIVWEFMTSWLEIIRPLWWKSTNASDGNRSFMDDSFRRQSGITGVRTGRSKADVDLCLRKWIKSINLLAAAVNHLAILEQIPERVIGDFQALCSLTRQGPGSTVKITKTYLSNAVVHYRRDQQPLQACYPA